MNWAIWVLTSGVIFSLGFYVGHRLGYQEGIFAILQRGPR